MFSASNFSLFTRLSFNYFWYCAVLGLIILYLPMYLESKGLNSFDIGKILAIFTVARILSPSLGAYIADKTGQQIKVIRNGTLCATSCFILMFWANHFWSLAIILAIFSTIWNAILPQLELHTLNSIRSNAKIYGRIRMYGSFGFITLSILSGALISDWGLLTFNSIGLVTLVALYLSTCLLKEKKLLAIEKHESHTFYNNLKSPSFILFIFSGLFYQISFGPFFNFFTLYLRDLEYPTYAAGLYVSVGVLAEIAMFLIIGRLYKRFGAILLIIFSLLITAFRWYLMATMASNPMVLFMAQIIHATSFGMYHIASIQFIQGQFKKPQQNQAQALFFSVVYGIGGAVGAYVSGYLWQDGLGAELTFKAAVVSCLIAGLLAFCMLFHKKPTKNLKKE